MTDYYEIIYNAIETNQDLDKILNNVSIQERKKIFIDIMYQSHKGYDHWYYIAEDISNTIEKYKIIIPKFNENNNIHSCSFHIQSMIEQLNYCLNKMEYCLTVYKLAKKQIT